MTFPDPMPNKEVIDPETGAASLVPMTQEEYIAAMPLYVYPVANEGAAE
jgi:hypothetical protein